MSESPGDSSAAAAHTNDGVSIVDGVESNKGSDEDYVDESETQNVRASGGTKRAPTNHGSNAPDTTSRVSKKRKQVNKKKIRLKIGLRVKSKRSLLYHALTPAQRVPIPTHVPNDYCFFGNVKSGNSKIRWNVAFDILPANDNVVHLMKNKIIIVQDDEEEKPFEPHRRGQQAPIDSDDEYAETIPKKAKKLTPMQQSIKDFCAQDDDKLAKATKYDMPYGREDAPNQKFSWKIHAETEYVTDCPFNVPSEGPTINMDFSKPIADNFFDSVFPSVEGHAKKIDKYLRDSRASYHGTYYNRKLKFHDEEADDPDWKVKQAYLLIIAASSEIENGVENLWKKGPTGGRKMYPDFGQYMDEHEFKCFASAAAFCWAEEKYWFVDKRDMPWEVFLPCLKSFNEKRRALLTAVLLVFDETMSGWKPKTSKLGGLPNYTCEPRKPVSLGTMLRNAAETVTATLTFQDPAPNEA